MKRALLIIAAILSLTVVAAAQGRKGNFVGSFSQLPTEHVFKIGGTELYSGTIDSWNDVCWGNTFMVEGAADNMDVMLNYSFDWTSVERNPKVTNRITTGRWTMSVYTGGRYAGTLYGEILGGDMNWQMNEYQQISAGTVMTKVMLMGGTGDYEFAAPAGGTLQAFTDFTGKKPVTTAVIYLTF